MLGGGYFLSETRKEQLEQSCLEDWLGKNVVNGIRSDKRWSLFLFLLWNIVGFLKNWAEIDIKLNHSKVNNSVVFSVFTMLCNHTSV